MEAAIDWGGDAVSPTFSSAETTMTAHGGRYFDMIKAAAPVLHITTAIAPRTGRTHWLNDIIFRACRTQAQSGGVCQKHRLRGLCTVHVVARERACCGMTQMV